MSSSDSNNTQFEANLDEITEGTLESNISNKTSGKSKVKRFIFTIGKDIRLLHSALSVNPFQLGKEKWAEVSSNLKSSYGYEVKGRTAKERIDTLLKKYKNEELEVKTGTEEQRTERGDLLKEIQILIEQESHTILDELGCDADLEFEASESLLSKSTPQARKPLLKQQRAEKRQADEERDELLGKYYSDAPPDPNAHRRKRTKAAQEEDLILAKQQHEIMMDDKKFALEQEVKRAELLQEDKRLEIEILREKRLAEEGQERKELMLVLRNKTEFMQRHFKPVSQ